MDLIFEQQSQILERLDTAKRVRDKEDEEMRDRQIKTMETIAVSIKDLLTSFATEFIQPLQKKKKVAFGDGGPQVHGADEAMDQGSPPPAQNPSPLAHRTRAALANTTHRPPGQLGNPNRQEDSITHPRNQNNPEDSVDPSPTVEPPPSNGSRSGADLQ